MNIQLRYAGGDELKYDASSQCVGYSPMGIFCNSHQSKTFHTKRPNNLQWFHISLRRILKKHTLLVPLVDRQGTLICKAYFHIRIY